MKKLLRIIIVSTIFIVVIVMGWICLLLYTAWPPNEKTVKRSLEAKNLLPIMIAGAQRDANGVTPAFSDIDRKRLTDVGINFIDNLYSVYHINRKGLQFELGGPDCICGILVVADGQAPPYTGVYYDPWGNGVWWYAQWPLRGNYRGEGN